MSPLALLTLMAGAAASLTPPGEVTALLRRMEAASVSLHGYTARFVRQERVGGTLRPREEALMKFQRPGRLYLRWVSGPSKGREMLFVEGRDRDRVLVHEPGTLTGLFTVVLAPDSPRVLRESRHPVTDIGLGRLTDLIVGNARRALERAELTVLDHGLEPDPGPRRRFELVLPRDRAQGYYCYRALVSLDVASGLALRATIYDWDDRMVGEYAYLDLQPGVSLGPVDFDPANPAYGFPRWRVVL